MSKFEEEMKHSKEHSSRSDSLRNTLNHPHDLFIRIALMNKS